LCTGSLLWASLVNAQNNQPEKVRPPFKKDSSFHRPPPMQGKQGDERPQPPMHKGFAKGEYGKPHPFKEKGKDFAINKLHLSKEQMQQEKSINENYHKQLAALQQNDKMSLGEYKSKVAALQKDRKAKMQAVLTTEQRNKIEEGKKKMQENAQVRAAANLERMKIHLNLTDEQEAKIKAGQTAFRTKMKALHENNALLPEQKKEQMKALALQQKESMKAVLTAEQQSKLDSLKTILKTD